jgi:hypothetical protein
VKRALVQLTTTDSTCLGSPMSEFRSKPVLMSMSGFRFKDTPSLKMEVASPSELGSERDELFATLPGERFAHSHKSVSSHAESV